MVHRFSCSAACGIFPDQGLDPCPLRWLVDPFTTEPPGKALVAVFYFTLKVTSIQVGPGMYSVFTVLQYSSLYSRICMQVLCLSLKLLVSSSQEPCFFSYL